MIKIYTLSDPITLDVRYVGKTSYSLNDRLAKHLCIKEKNYRGNWIRKLLNLKQKPIIEILEEVTESSWKKSEIFWIEQMKNWGFNLVNLTKGGESGIISIQCREACIKSIKGKVMSKEEKLRRSLNSPKSKIIIAEKESKYTEYRSASEAARVTNSNLAHITECCNGKRKTHNKYKWKYK